MALATSQKKILSIIVLISFLSKNNDICEVLKKFFLTKVVSFRGTFCRGPILPKKE
jgi:hypothetical protein